MTDESTTSTPARSGKPVAEFASISRERIRQLLIIRLSALGDVIHVLPALRALREHFPDAEITWVTEPLGALALEGNPWIDHLEVFPRKRFERALRDPRQWRWCVRTFGRLVRTLRGREFDLSIDFQGNMRSGLLQLICGSRYRLGFHWDDCREFLGACFTNLRPKPAPLLDPKVLKNLYLVRQLGWEGECPRDVVVIPEADRRWAQEVIAGLPGTGPLVLVHPAVSPYGLIKQWPVRYYRVLCERLIREHDARVLLSWGPGERELAEEVGHGVIAPDTARLLKLAALIERSDLLIASDTGCLHLSAAIGTPVVGLYGPKSPRFYGPYPRRGRVVASEVPCSPCKVRKCPHRICMSSISPDVVYRAAIEALEAATVENA